MPHDEQIDLLDLDFAVFADYYAQIAGWVAAEAPPAPRVVDLGAGSGAGTLLLARHLPGSHVTAVDQHPEMLDRVRTRAGEAGLGDRVEVVQADLDQPWPDLGAVDVLWASASLHHLQDPAGALASAHAALRPGGLLVVAEVDSFPTFLAGAPDEHVEQAVRAELAARRDRAGLHMHEDWGRRATAAGFADVRSRRAALDVPPPVDPAAARYAQLTLTRVRALLHDQWPADDLAALDRLLASLPHRDDLHLRADRTVWLARR